MKRILIAIMFVVGLSGAAQAKITHLQCGGVYIAIDMEKKKIIQPSLYKTFSFLSDNEIRLHNTNNVFITINRISLEYFALNVFVDEGTCAVGRKF